MSNKINTYQDVLWCADCGDATASGRLPCGWWLCRDCWGRYAPSCRECSGCAPWCALSLTNGNGMHCVAPPAAEAQTERVALRMTTPEPVCPQCGNGGVTFCGKQLIVVNEDWTRNRCTAHDAEGPSGDWVGPVQGECVKCGHQWAVLPDRPTTNLAGGPDLEAVVAGIIFDAGESLLNDDGVDIQVCQALGREILARVSNSGRPPKTSKSDQAYLVVYLDGGTVTGHEVTANVDQARRKCLAYVDGSFWSVTEDDFIYDVHNPTFGPFGIGNDLDLKAWAFPIPAKIVADNRPANEDRIRLSCKFSTTGMGLCGWTGLASEAGWNSHYDEWICPACGSTDGLRVVDTEPEAQVPPEPSPDDWFEEVFVAALTELDDHASGG